MVKNKKWHIKKIAALAGAVVLAVSSAALYAAPQVKAANGPCDTGDWAYAYINVRIGEDSTLIFSSKGTNSIAGMSYDRESNTLTLNDFKNKAAVIVTNMMGDDFKINLIGDNEIGSIGSYGDAWGGSINICGNGSLIINADKADDYSVALFAEGTDSVLSVADTCNVTIYSGTKAVVYTSDNLTDKPIRDKGTLKENVSYNVSHPLEISRICAKYYEYDPYTTNTVYKSATDNTSLYYIKKLTYVEPAKVTYTVYKLTFTAKSADDNTIVDVSDGNTTIKADEIKKIIEDNKANDVVIKSNNDVTFTFAKGTMSEVSQVEIYDFSTEITSDIKEAGNIPEDVTEDIFVSKIVYNYSGTLPARASIRLNVGKAYAGQRLYYSQLLDDGTIISMMSAIVDNDGYMTVEQDHCSTYLITRQQLTGNSTENVTEASDNKVETPQTGDNSNVALWLTLCIILSCGITLYIFAVKARKMNR